MKVRGWIIAICVMALMVGGLYWAANLNARRAAQEERRLLEDAIYRAAVTCYALEGRYPPTLRYLEDNYAIAIDAERYAVFYDSFADNVLPSIRIVERGGEASAR